MSLLNKPKYSRQPPQEEFVTRSNSLLEVLASEEHHLIAELQGIEEAKSREPNLLQRLNVVQNSLSAFLALEQKPEPMQEQPQEKRIRKAATKKTDKPTSRSIVSETVVSNTKNIDVVHDDFSTFPE